MKTREYKVARYAAGSQSVTQTIPRSGWYKVKWKVRDEMKGVDHTKRYLTRGATVGFETAPDGNVVALIDDQRVVVGQAAPKAKYCCWYSKSKEPTQFAREVQKVLASTGEVMQVVAIGGIVVGGATMLLLTSDHDHDEYDSAHRRDR